MGLTDAEEQKIFDKLTELEKQMAVVVSKLESDLHREPCDHHKVLERDFREYQQDSLKRRSDWNRLRQVLDRFESHDRESQEVRALIDSMHTRLTMVEQRHQSEDSESSQRGRDWRGVWLRVLASILVALLLGAGGLMLAGFRLHITSAKQGTP